MKILEYKNIFLSSVLLGILTGLFGYWLLFFLILVLMFCFFLEKFDLALLLLIFYLPFQVALNISSGFDVASGRVLILLFFLVWILKSLKDKKLIINFSLQTLLIFIFLFIASISVLWSFEIDRAIRKLLVFYSIFPLYFILTSFVDKNFIIKIAKVIFCGLGFVLLFGGVQFFSQFLFGIDTVMGFFSLYVAPIFYGNTFGAEVVSNPSWLVNVAGVTLMRAFSIFPDPHMFSFYMGLVLPIFIPFMFLQNSSKFVFGSRFIFFGVVATALVLELLSFSRGGYLGMFFSFITMIVLLWKSLSKNQKKILTTFGLVFSLLIFVIDNSVVSRFFSIFDLNEGSNSERIENWSQGYDLFSNNLISGVGIGNYSYNLNPLLEYRDPVYAHNLYIDLGAEMGIFSLLCWVLIFTVTIWQLIVVVRRNRKDYLHYLSVGLVGSLVWFSVHAFFDTPIYSPQILSILVVIFSISVLVIRFDRDNLLI